MNLFGKTSGTPESDFWDEFVRTSPSIIKCPDTEQRVSLLRSIFDKYDSRLSFEFNIDPPNSHLIVSADGDIEVFPVVKKLVENAPEISGWTITPFRQRTNTYILDFIESSIRISQDDIYFRLYESQKPNRFVDLEVFLRGITGNEVEDSSLMSAGYVFLDMIFGEYDMETGIGYIEWHPLPENIEDLCSAAEAVSIFDDIAYPKINTSSE